MLKIIAHRNDKLRDRVQERWYRARGKDPQSMFEEMLEEVIRFETC